MNIPWTKIIGAGLILYALYTAYSGEVDMTNKRRYNAPKMIYTRKDHPWVFWPLIGLMIVLGVFALLLPM